GGRAMLGIGAAWNEEESVALGIPFPPVAERFEQLEEAVQICLRMWSGDESPFHGRQFQLERPLNSPQPLTRPHPPIMIGGGGEKKTLRFVARYAQSCNLFGGPELEHKLDVLRQHCANEGRDYDEIEKTASYYFDLGEHGERVDETLAALRGFADLGIDTAHGKVAHAEGIDALELMGREIIPAVEKF
ncbi:MAG TPA: LLM class flavin-dependent oxidoreductase, partial [Pseudonocardiaceae bacterium]|nr:LLM class flavin-dependent oxidoreductase [Pseudonocardiaceae bacterium]